MSTDTSQTQEALTKIDNYVSLGWSGLKVSPLCLGTMTFGQQEKKDDDILMSKKVFDKYYELGGNFFDASNFGTGESERILGQYIADKRSRVIISTKYTTHPNVQDTMDPNLGDPNRKSLVENLNASLERLGVGYIDILYTHIDYRNNIENILKGLDDVIRSGKALYIAITDTPAWVISEANMISHFRGWSQFVALSTQYSMVDRSFEFDLQPMCLKHKLLFQKFISINSSKLFTNFKLVSILKYSFLSNRYTKDFLASDFDFPVKKVVSEFAKKEKNWKILEEVVQVANEIERTPSEVAINWTLQQPGVTSVVAAARNLDILEENIRALEFKLTPKQLSALNDASLPSEIPFTQIPKPNPMYYASKPTVEYISSLKTLDKSKTTDIE
ncbi:19675_t:CDS:10 [Dentiscutata erythropus]|uniref:19675_t:CDS:1 n=1 Tax=Dentiscutata erythropus TaxID=1348616 RepID=A0A9N8ZLR1_9GLOM|nr:19675_t:CDS:10 [Dentiscutata erythropus]